MTTDTNKDIGLIQYNHLNLPTRIEFSASAGDERAIVYTYDATGVKLKKEIFLSLPDLFNPVANTTTYYAGNYIYEKDGSGESLKFFSHPEGYIEKNGSNYDYVYQYKDHSCLRRVPRSAARGRHIRPSYQDMNNNGAVDSSEIKEENNYYPFGLKMKGFNNVVTGRDHKYGFGGKEEQSELGLDWMDFHARNYDASLGRWMNVDLLAANYYDWSPYSYVYNNPILFLDPDGMQIDISDIFENSENLANGIQLLLDLSQLTGLSLSYNSSGGKLDYLKNEDGSAVTNYADGVTLGSNTARNLLTDSIDDESVIKVERRDLYGSNFTPSTNTMKLDYRQIDSQSSTTSSGLYHKTAGYGMTFLHELGHADSNGNLKDTNGSNFGGNMIQMNKIRSELDANPLNRVLSGGDQFGQRASYTGSYAINPNDKLAGNLYDVKARMKFTILNSRGKKKNKGLTTRKNQIINTN